MILFELFEDDPRKSEKDDKTVLSLNDTRKTRLTLRQIRRLRKMNHVRDNEQKKKVDAVQQQYKSAPSDTEMPM